MKSNEMVEKMSFIHCCCKRKNCPRWGNCVDCLAHHGNNNSVSASCTKKVRIRKYQPNDLEEILLLFYHTVHTINRADYTKEQLDAWAPRTVDKQSWSVSLEEHDSVVAVYDHKIVGFGDMRKDGYLDRLYVHHEFQKRGVAGRIADLLESKSQEWGITHITTEASITARLFFELRGYTVVKAQKVYRQGIGLDNLVMEKSLR